MKKIALSCAVLLCAYTAFAQKTLKGKIFDKATNTPLSGATVSFGGKGAITTDKNGMFSIECGKTTKLTISFVGYETNQVFIKNCDDELNIGLAISSQYLDNVEISATSNQNKSLLYQPVSIIKLTTTELKRGNGLFLDDAINGNVPGVTMNRRTVSGGQQFNIRGYGNGTRGTRGISSNFDGQGYKVYLNGIPITDAEGITTLDDIDYSSIGNVEVVKGPAGTLYGLAIAGAVNLKTAKPEKGKTALGQDIMIGNYGLQRYTTHFQMGTDRSTLLVNYGHQKFDGSAYHNKSHKDFVNVAGDFQTNEKQSFTSFFGYTNSYDERLGELTLTQWASKDYSGNPEYIKRNAHSHVSTFRGGFGHTYAFSKNISNSTVIFGTGFRSDVSSAGGWTDKTSINYGLRSTFDTRFGLTNGITLSGLTGVETQRQNASTIGYSMKISPFDAVTTGANPWVVGRPYYIIDATTSNNATLTGTTSLFTQWTLALPKDLSLTAGIGVSNMKVILDDRLNPTTVTRPSHYDTSYKGMVSPNIAINKVFSKKISVYASYSKGYKAPVSANFFITTPGGAPPVTSKVNSVLKPESGSQFEIGTKGAVLSDKLSYQLALFDTKFKNKMTAVAVQYNATTTAYSYVVNAGDQEHKGIEALLKYTVYQSANGFFRTVTPFVNYTYSDFNYGSNFKYQTGTTTSNITTVDYSNKQVAGVAKHVFNWGFDIITRPGLYLNFIHNYKGGMPITSDGVNLATSYNLLNTKIGFQKAVSSHFDLDVFVGVNNITGTQYPIMVFVNQLPDAYIPAPPKAVVFGGLSVKYNFNK
jgi:iron complex outermembrane recepter protein